MRSDKLFKIIRRTSASDNGTSHPWSMLLAALCEIEGKMGLFKRGGSRASWLPNAQLPVAIVLIGALSPLPASSESIPKLSTLKRVLQFWDPNGDGQITLEELSKYRSGIHAVFDQNSDLVWDREEYEVYVVGLKRHREKMSAELREETMPLKRTLEWEFNDVDGNGLVSRGEFAGGASFWINLLDINYDGLITMEDGILLAVK